MLKGRIALFTLLIAAAVSGCGGARPTPPTAPTPDRPPVQPPNPDPAFHIAEVTLSGIVFEHTPAGRRPIEGVDVLNGEGDSASTDADGFYSLGPVWVCPCAAQPGVAAGMTFLWVRKSGYTDPSATPPSVFGPAAGSGTRDVRIDGDTRFDIELVRR